MPDDPQQKREKAVKLVRKLWMTAAHPGTEPAEYNNAIQKALKLIREHEIELHEIQPPPEEQQLDPEPIIPGISNQELGDALKRAGTWLIDNYVTKRRRG